MRTLSYEFLRGRWTATHELVTCHLCVAGPHPSWRPLDGDDPHFIWSPRRQAFLEVGHVWAPYVPVRR